jgi:hypothetical protein
MEFTGIFFNIESARFYYGFVLTVPPHFLSSARNRDLFPVLQV